MEPFENQRKCYLYWAVKVRNSIAGYQAKKASPFSDWPAPNPFLSTGNDSQTETQKRLPLIPSIRTQTLSNDQGLSRYCPLVRVVANATAHTRESGNPVSRRTRISARIKSNSGTKEENSIPFWRGSRKRTDKPTVRPKKASEMTR